MKCTLSNFLIFTGGAIVGSVITWKYLKTKYEQIAREEIESVKEYYDSKAPVAEDTETTAESEVIETVTVKKEDPVKREYNRLVERYNPPVNKPATSVVDGPYVIPPEEFGEADYEQTTLIYFADGVLTDECYEPVASINETVGRESLLSFGLYEDDAVHVRNDELKTDFEILADTREYTKVVNNGPQLTET